MRGPIIRIVFFLCGVEPYLQTVLLMIPTPILRLTLLGRVWALTLRLKMAQKPYIIWSLGPKALKYESLEP